MRSLLFPLFLLVLVLSTRFIPHWPNFTAVGAIAFAGLNIFRPTLKSWVLSMLALYLSDVIINNTLYGYASEGFSWFYQGMGFVYLAYAGMGLMGWLSRQNTSWVHQSLFASLASLFFFALSNFGAWIGNPLYTQDSAGLMTALVAGIPFGFNFLVSTVLYAAVLRWVQQRVPSLSLAN